VEGAGGEFRKANNGSKDIVEVVRYPAGQHIQTLQFLHVAQLGFQAAALFAVAACRGYVTRIPEQVRCSLRVILNWCDHDIRPKRIQVVTDAGLESDGLPATQGFSHVPKV